MQFEGLHDMLLSVLLFTRQAEQAMIEYNLTQVDLAETVSPTFNPGRWYNTFVRNFEFVITVHTTTRGGQPAAVSLPIKLVIQPAAQDPIDRNQYPLKPKLFNKLSYWDVNIRVAQRNIRVAQRQADVEGNCYMSGIMLPYQLNPDTLDKVIVTWLYQVMINPETHKQVPIVQCLGNVVPDLPWGTVFMQLFETINQIIAEEIYPVVVAGLVDDSFVTYCNESVVFSDFRRMNGQLPWYETYGYKLANENEYDMIFNSKTVLQAQGSVEGNYRLYIEALQACDASALTPDEVQLVCKKGHGQTSCDTGTPHRVVRERIAHAIRENDKNNGCYWISDKAPLTCFTQFNRHHNTQVIRLPDPDTGILEEMAVRLKFYVPRQ